MTVTVINNARIFDGHNMLDEDRLSVVIENHRIVEVGVGADVGEAAIRIDAGGRFLMPGLIDAHYHVKTPSYDFYATDRMPGTLLGAHAMQLMSGALSRGYTTLRDAAGGDFGCWAAVEQGVIKGPRLFYPGRALTQTGGHADMRRRDFVEPCGCAQSGVLAQPVDGPDEVRKAAREEFRQGAHQIKIFVSGGVSTDLAPIWMPHFCDEEISAAVEEATRRRSYVMAHCHTDEGARRCIDLGVRTIEHGSFIRPETARDIAATGRYVVPTLAAGELIARHAADLGLPATAADKVHEVNEASLLAVEACAAAGVKLGLGCDLHGQAFVARQGRELWLRGQVQPAIDVLRSATSVNGEIVQMGGELGVIAPGALADLILVDGDPLRDLALFEDGERNIPLVMKGGEIVHDRRGSSSS